jgi:hypothetical protein
MSRTAAAAFRRVDAAGWLAGLPAQHREMVESRAFELTRGRLRDLTPGLQGLAFGVVRDELLELSIETEVFGSTKRRLVNKNTGKVAAWVPELVRLRESLDRRREKLDKALVELEPKRAVSLADYLESRGSRVGASEPEHPEPETRSPSFALAGAESAGLDVGSPPGREEPENGFRTESKPFSADSGKCEWCGAELPARTRRGEARRFCPGGRCRKAAWVAAKREGIVSRKVEP